MGLCLGEKLIANVSAGGGGGGGTPITVDTQMSDTSTNAVQNKVIKSYVDSNIPEVVSALENDAGYITNSVSNLLNYYLKTETYTKEEVNQALQSIISAGLKTEIVSQFPTDPSTNTIYLIYNAQLQIYDQWMYIGEQWQHLGTTAIDMSDYYTKGATDALLNGKADIESLNGYVAYTAQTSTEEQKRLARENIGIFIVTSENAGTFGLVKDEESEPETDEEE